VQIANGGPGDAATAAEDGGTAARATSVGWGEGVAAAASVFEWRSG